METTQKWPPYAMLSIVLMGLLAFFYIMYIGQDIVVPIVFSMIIAILLNPVVNILNKWLVNRVVAILLALTVAIALIAGLMYFIGMQATMFSDSMPQFKEKFIALFDDLIKWISVTFGIKRVEIIAWIDNVKGKGLGNSTSLIGQTLGTISGILIMLFLIPVYVFMILFYKPLLLEFISRLFKREKHAVVAEVLMESKTLIQSYLIGLLLEAALVAILNSVSLLIIGVEYAILIGIIGALLNVIPYIGGLIAIAIPMLVAIATGSPVDALWVFVAYMIVQFIDNNYFVPKIVASKVKVNGLVSIIVVLIGGALWGVSGMFLSIPITAIIKVIFDRIEALTPFGFLLGDNQSVIGKVFFNFKIPIRTQKLKKV